MVRLCVLYVLTFFVDSKINSSYGLAVKTILFLEKVVIDVQWNSARSVLLFQKI